MSINFLMSTCTIMVLPFQEEKYGENHRHGQMV